VLFVFRGMFGLKTVCCMFSGGCLVNCVLYDFRGMFGLWFDEDLYHGRTNKCETFNNDILTSSEDFVMKTFEAWAFVD